MHTYRLILWPSVVALGLLLASATAVFAASPGISVLASGSTPFSTLTIGGSGFNPGETVSLSLGLNSTTAAADASGTFSGATLQIPNVPSGLYYVIAVGQSSGMVAFSSVWVNSFFPTAGPSSWYLAPGSTLTWSGSGFSPNESITLTDGAGATLATFSADGSGSFTAAGPTIVPFSARNSVITYKLKGAASGANFSYMLAVGDLYPYANPSSWYARPGTPVTFSGSGFAGGETINLYLGTSTSSLASATADSSGAFLSMGPVNLPFGSVASYRLVGAQSGAIASVPITLAGFYPTITPSSYYSNPGGLITLTGSGFAGNESVEVMVGPAAHTAITDSTGSFTLTDVQVPATPNTPATISGVGAQSGASTSFSMAIGQYYPSITPSLWYSFPGDTVTFEGSGFAPNETVTITGAGSGTVATDSLGNFTGYSSTLPASNATFIFTGNKSITSFPLTIALGERFSAIWFNNYWDNGGKPITIFGAGFGSGETVSITHGGGTALTTATADSSGNFEAMTTIPYVMPGDLTITALGARTGSSGSAAMTVAPVWTSLEMASYAVTRGTAMTLIGSGYLPNEPLEVRTDRTGSAVVHTFSADGSGAFSDSGYTIPADFAEGLMTITVKSLHSFDEKSITFWVGI